MQQDLFEQRLRQVAVIVARPRDQPYQPATSQRLFAYGDDPGGATVVEFLPQPQSCVDCDRQLMSAPRRQFNRMSEKWKREYCQDCRLYRGPDGKFSVTRGGQVRKDGSIPIQPQHQDSQLDPIEISSTADSGPQVVVRDCPEFLIREFVKS
jgi:hypothetical protein